MTNLLFKGKKISDGNWITAESYEKDENGGVLIGGTWFVEPDSVGVFTGLHDINGEPVFTGDILTVSMTGLDMDVVITWNTYEAKFQADRVIGGKFSDITAAKVARWRLISNIHN